MKYINKDIYRIKNRLRNRNMISGRLNLIWADLREANLRESIFITQAQINSDKGDISTVLLTSIVRPSHWIE